MYLERAIVNTSIFLFTFSMIYNVTSAADIAPADQLLESRMRTPLLQSEGTLTGEGQCWHAAYHMGRFMEGYKKTDDTAYLEAGVKYYDALIEKMHRSPDGYKGWVGPYIYDKDYISDVHIGDAILINPMLEFSEIVLSHSDDEIVAEYKDKAETYINLAKKHLLEKWDNRGTWHEDGPLGAYKSWDQYMTEDNLDEWRKLPARNSNLSLPFNKQNSMGIAALRLYRITGESQYREKALKIFNYMKSRMNLYKDHYVWNYWEPFGPWDIEDDSKELRHWVNVHPYRNYQAVEIHEIVEAYHSGLTFTKEDIQHIINTNLKVMWNGDIDNPEWNNSNHAVQLAALGEVPVKEAPGGKFDNLAGTLWSALDDFDPTIRELTGNEYDEPVSFERKHKDLPVTIYERPFNSNKQFVMAAVMPRNIEQSGRVYLVCKTRVKGSLMIELLSANGEDKLAELHNNDNAYPKPHIIDWELQDTPKGDYQVRWSINGESREYPIEVK